MSEVFRVNKTKDFTVMANHHLRKPISHYVPKDFYP